MANSDEILDHILRHPPSSPHPINYSFLAPNIKGFSNAIKVIKNDAPISQNGARSKPHHQPLSESLSTITNAPKLEFSVFAAATESFTQKNLNCDIATSLERFKPVIQGAKAEGFRVRAYISVVLGCPFEGEDVDPQKVAEIATDLMEMGADEIDLGDTTGMGTMTKTDALLKAMTAAGVRNEDIAMHFHDTYGQALANTFVSLQHGIRIFDSSVGGLGGCPYSPGATGNVATEDMVYFIESLGMETGVDVDALADIGGWITGEIGKPNGSAVGKALLGKRARM
jgi:hydroxymethylglutaryl-CoA lyase